MLRDFRFAERQEHMFSRHRSRSKRSPALALRADEKLPRVRRARLWLMFAFATTLGAAEFWESKPFQTWSAKDIEELRTRSPWAHGLSAAVPVAEILVFGGEGRRAAAGSTLSANAGQTRTPIGGADRTLAIPAESEPQAADTRVIPMIIRWDSALPLRLARLREKYSDEVLTSAAAGKSIQQEATEYIVFVSGFPPLNESHIQSGLDRALLEGATPRTRGRDAVKPLDVDIAPRGRLLDVTLTFPKTMPFTIQDQEVEFSMSAGSLHVKHKFRLKDMVYQGSLAL